MTPANKTVIKVVFGLIVGFLMMIDLGLIAYFSLPILQSLQGSPTRFEMTLAPEPNGSVSESDVETAMRVIETRLYRLGAAGVSVERDPANDGHIVVKVSTAKSNSHVKEVLAYDGILELTPLVKGTHVPYLTRKEAEAAAREAGFAEFNILEYRSRNRSSRTDERGWVIAEKRPLITDADIRDAYAQRDQNGRPAVGFILKPESAERFGAETEKRIGSPLAIVLGRQVTMAPVITARITSQGEITGDYLQEEAETLAITLYSGRLPHPLKFVSEQTISTWDALPFRHIRIACVLLVLLLGLLAGLVFGLTR
jgi:protein-export membrane protein SecD